VESHKNVAASRYLRIDKKRRISIKPTRARLASPRLTMSNLPLNESFWCFPQGWDWARKVATNPSRL